MESSVIDHALARFDAFVHKLGNGVAWVSGLVLVALALLVAIDVFLRAAFNQPLAAGVEMTMEFLPWIVLPAFVGGLIAGTHVRMTLLTERLSPQARLWTDLFSQVVGFALFAGLTYWGWSMFWESFVIREIRLAAIPLPYWTAKLALPVGAFLIDLQFLNLLAHTLNRLAANRRKG